MHNTIERSYSYIHVVHTDIMHGATSMHAYYTLLYNTHVEQYAQYNRAVIQYILMMWLLLSGVLLTYIMSVLAQPSPSSEWAERPPNKPPYSQQQHMTWQGIDKSLGIRH